MNSNDNERFVTFHVPRPIQKRGKKKEKASSVSKKIGFIQIVHSESKKVICRSDNLWIRSKSREEMETKKRRANNTLSKKVKKRKIKAEQDQITNLPDGTATKLDTSCVKPTQPTASDLNKPTEQPDLKPKIAEGQFPFLPIMPNYFPNFFSTNFLPVIQFNQCCSVIPVQAYYDTSLSAQLSNVNYNCQQLPNSDILELTKPVIPCEEDLFDF